MPMRNNVCSVFTIERETKCQLYFVVKQLAPYDSFPENAVIVAMSKYEAKTPMYANIALNQLGNLVNLLFCKIASILG